MNVDPLDELRRLGFKVECRPELLSNGARDIVETGPCLFEGPLGPIKVKGLLVITEKPDPVLLKEIARIRISESRPLAIIVSKDNPGKDVEALASTLGILVSTLEAKLKTHKPSKEYTVIPQLDDSAARRIFEGKVKGSLLGLLGGVLAPKKVRFMGLRLVYFPLRCYDLLIHKLDEEAEALESRRSTLCFETATGTLVEARDGVIRLREELVRLGELEDEAVRVIEIVSSIGKASLSEIAEHLGDIERARVTTDVLVELGLLEPDYEGLFRVTALHLEDYGDPIAYYSERKLLIEGKPAKCTRRFEPGFELSKLDRIVKAFGLVEAVSTVYYPLYIGVFRKFKNERYVDVTTIIDAVVGERLEDLEEAIADSNMIYQLDMIVEEVTGEARTREPCPKAETPAGDS
ncbi:MAG: hypothetical protein F7C38_00800 [Desulfurococcales archaeon]|nr:hypothetical protein [Desulfurococcales archaeon]